MFRFFMGLCVLVLCAAPTLAQTSIDTRGDVGGSGISGGSIIPGADTEACVGAKAGAIRFNSASSCVEYCNGTSWNCPGSGVGCTIGSAVGDGICAGNLAGYDLVVTQAGCAENAASAADCSGNDADTQMHWAWNNVDLDVEACTAGAKECTDRMISASEAVEIPIRHSVARYCRRHTIDGAEWQVPNTAELTIIDRNRATGAWTNGGFVTGHYWTSSQPNTNNAITHQFYATAPMSRPGINNSSWVNLNIRCVRLTPQ